MTSLTMTDTLTCRHMTPADLKTVIPLYIDHYNTHEDGVWTEETTRRRIEQVMTRMDSMCLVFEAEHHCLGFAMGYFEQYDDISAYDLVEILIRHDFQSQGIGTAAMALLEQEVKARGGAMIQLQSVNDEMHHHFYGKLGYGDCKNLVIKSKWL